MVSALVVFLPHYVQWTWLGQHPNRTGLYITALLIVWGLAWAVIDSKRRWVAGAALVIGAILVLAQIVQR